MKVYNKDTATYYNREQNNSNEENKRLKPHKSIKTSQEHVVKQKNWIEETLKDF